MNVLSIFPLPGVSYTHDASACFITDDGVQFAADEERFLRSQHAIGHYPERSAMVGMQTLGLSPRSIDLVTTASIERCRRRPDYRVRLQFVRDQLQIPASAKSLCVPHHLAHSALAVLTSPFDSCVFLTFDGGGDGGMGHWGTFDGRRFRVLETYKLSPAVFFTYLTSLCGFAAFEEGKVMGLAAYGQVESVLYSWFAQHFTISRAGAALETNLRLEWDGVLDFQEVDADTFRRSKYLRWRLKASGSNPPDWVAELAPQDIAKTGQVFFTALVQEAVNNLSSRTGEARFALSGGAFQNVATTGELGRAHPNRTFFVPLAPHDAGLSVGAGLWARHVAGQPRFSGPLSPLLGPTWVAADVERVLEDFGLHFERPSEFEQEVAALIADGLVVGWFNGRAEFGARALGARSVLADPRDATMRPRVNQLLKKRDWFMPYAPSILAEFGAEFFEDFRPSPYMNVAFRVRPDVSRRIPAAVHADGTCRAHVVESGINDRYRCVIQSFCQLTGIPMVLNTSFNRHGLPMVATPRQAVHLLLEGCVEVLAIEGFIVRSPRPRIIRQLREDVDCLTTDPRRAAS